MTKNTLFSILFFFIFFSYFNFQSFAQISQGGKPISFNPLLVNSLKSNIPVQAMPVFDIFKLQSEDLVNDNHKEIPWRFGNNIPVNIDVKNQGVNDKLANGDNLWRLRIYSAGAFSINLGFNHYEIPQGAKLFIYNEQKTQVLGAFTNYNNQIDKVFATTLIEGEAIILEYFEPVNVSFSGTLKINRVTHGYRNVYDGVAKNFGTSGSCEINVACATGIGWENEIKSVCMLVVGGSGFCTGALINNTTNNGTPYVLTANHCSTSNDFAQWVFWFNWQSATCSNPASSPTHNETTASGCVLKARNAGSDFCLVQMNATTIPSNFNVFFAGWNNSTTAATSAMCIHHPDGDIKKISPANTTMISSTYSSADCWQANWTNLAVTEPGSSGSPLFDQNHRIIGQLYGGPSACGVASGSLNDYFGKLCTSWNTGTTSATRLKEWLDPGVTNITAIDGFDPNASAVVNPTAFSATTASAAQIDLAWTKNIAADNVMIAYNSTSTFGTPTGAYSAGNAISGGGTVIYNGPASTFNHTLLNAATTYYYKAWSVNTIDGFSNGTTANATTLCNVVSTFPYNEGFENGGSITTCWSTEVVGTSTIAWQFITGDGSTHPATAHAGTYNACLIDQTTTADKSKLVSPAFDISQLSSPQLKFWHTQAVRQSRQDQLSVYYKTSASGTWTLLNTYTASITAWTQETINLPAASSTYFIAFEGSAVNAWGVCIDDVSITGVTSTPPIVSTTAASAIMETTATSGGNVTSIGSSAVTARGVCWSTSINPTIANAHTTDGSGIGAFTSTITGLTAATLYHVRAYATNSTSTAYGSDVTFTTSQIPGYTVNGNILYNNASLSAMVNTTVLLMNGTTQSASTTTDANGNFSFSNIPNGTYTFSCTTTSPWNGVTATDALKMKRHISSLEFLTELIRLTGADVNASNSINSTDVLKVQRRIASLDLSFTRPDWIFEFPSVGGTDIIVNGANTTQNLYALCTGDVNGTNIPTLILKSSSIAVDNSSVIKAKNSDFIEIPVRISDITELGAFQIFMDYPSDIFKISDISMEHDNQDLIFSDMNGQLRIVWSSLTSMHLSSGDAILKIKAQIINASATGNYIFNIKNETEFADSYGNIIQNPSIHVATVEVMTISDLTHNNLHNLVSIFPNPSRNQVICSFDKKSTIVSSIKVFDIVGKQISVDVLLLSSGSYLLNFTEQEAGFYFIHLETNDGKISRKISINK